MLRKVQSNKQPKGASRHQKQTKESCQCKVISNKQYFIMAAVDFFYAKRNPSWSFI